MITKKPFYFYDDYYSVWGAGHVDIVTDNAGYELFTDMCLGDLLLTTGKATTVVLNVMIAIGQSESKVSTVLSSFVSGLCKFRPNLGV
jgi:hypothetical protein